MTELFWPFGRALWAGRIGRTKEIIVQSITDTVTYWRRYKEAQNTLMAVPQHLLDDFGICQKQIPTIAAYVAITQVNIAVAIDDFARLPPAPLPDFNVRCTQIALRAEPESRALANFLCGCAAMAKSPLIVTPVGMFMGFGALAHDTGFSIAWTALASMLMFATPGQILLMTGMSHDAALLTIAVAVTLTAVRYAPMNATLVPLMKFPGVRAWHIVFPVHCAVISLWLEALRLLPNLPCERRVAFCNGMAAIFFTAGMMATVAGFYLAGAMPPLFAAALLFVTPISFLVITAASSRALVDKLALILGLSFSAGAWLLGITFDMLWVGVIAGTVAYGIQRTQRRCAWAT